MRRGISKVLSALLISSMAIGVANADDVTITDSTPSVIFNDTDTGSNEWQIYGNGDAGNAEFKVVDLSSMETIFDIDRDNKQTCFYGGKFCIDSDGNIVATYTGTKYSRVKLFKFSYENTDSPNDDGDGVAKTPRPKSDVGIRLVNAKKSETWTMRTYAKKHAFTISKLGTGQKEFMIKNDGSKTWLILGNGAYCDGEWVNASSRAYKKEIKPLETTKAIEAFKNLQPVTYRYKDNPNDLKVGFIAEDVPDLVALPDRKGVSAIEFAALLTKVVQEQQKEIESLKAEVEKLNAMKAKVAQIESLLSNLALKAPATTDKVSAITK